MKNVIAYLKARDFIDCMTSEAVEEFFNEPRRVYIGFDMTADSMHLGNLVGVVTLKWFQKFGHTPVVLLGGATTKVGDPSGKDKERPLLDLKAIDANLVKIRQQFERFLDFSGDQALLLNNDDWFASINFIDFLRDVGKHFRLGPMLGKESVKARLNSEEGMSFTEFCYQLLQGYDFFHLNQEHDVVLQAGGSDQWGNITAGIELARKLGAKNLHGLTFPLLTRSDGKKFGKSEEGAIWLSEELCSPYKFYQYLIKVPDADVTRLMRMLTFMEIEEIEEIEKAMANAAYEPNSAQRRLAEEVTRFVHGEEGLEAALRATSASTKLDLASLKEAASDLPSAELAKSEVMGLRFADVAVKAGLISSKGEANRLIKNGGAYLNNEKISDLSFSFSEKDLIGNQYLLLGAGKKKRVLISVLKKELV